MARTELAPQSRREPVARRHASGRSRRATATAATGALMLAIAGTLAGCTTGEQDRAAASGTPTATGDDGDPSSSVASSGPASASPSAAPIVASGTGPGTVEIPNPYFPFDVGRETLLIETDFTCNGDGEAWVRLLPESTGAYVGSSECRGLSSDLLVGRSQEVYTLEVSVDAEATWTLEALLTE